MELITNYLYMFGYGIVAAITMSVAMSLLIFVWNRITPIDEWEEIKKGNIAVAIILASVILGFSIVLASALMPT